MRSTRDAPAASCTSSAALLSHCCKWSWKVTLAKKSNTIHLSNPNTISICIDVSISICLLSLVFCITPDTITPLSQFSFSYSFYDARARVQWRTRNTGVWTAEGAGHPMEPGWSSSSTIRWSAEATKRGRQGTRKVVCESFVAFGRGRSCVFFTKTRKKMPCLLPRMA